MAHDLEDAVISNIMTSFSDTYKLMLKYGKEQKNPDVFLKLAKDLCITNHELKIKQQALQVAKKEQTMENFDKKFQESMTKYEKKTFNAETTKEFKAVKTALMQIAANAEQLEEPASSTSNRVVCDEFVMDSHINIFDPVTKKPMKHPVRNIICGHHYEKETILEMIRIKRKIHCPVTSCANTHFLLKHHLEEDSEFKKRIQAATSNESESQDPLAN